MKTLLPSLLLAALLTACGRPDALAEVPSEATPPSTATSTTSSTVSTTPAPTGPIDCLPDFVADQGVCQPAHAVSLTAIAAASSGLTIYAGAGQQPVLRVYVAGDLLQPGVYVHLLITAGEASLGADLRTLQWDALGAFFELPFHTAPLPEGSYGLVAWLLSEVPGDIPNGISSEKLTLVVDRTPPVVTVNGLPTQAVARDFVATAEINATSHTGMTVEGITVQALGPAVPMVDHPADPWATFAAPLQNDDLPPSVAAAESLISGAAIPDDAAGLNNDPAGVLVEVSATDVLGNVGNASVRIALQ